MHYFRRRNGFKLKEIFLFFWGGRFYAIDLLKYFIFVLLNVEQQDRSGPLDEERS